jgi:hypothetical protein
MKFRPYTAKKVALGFFENLLYAIGFGVLIRLGYYSCAAGLALMVILGTLDAVKAYITELLLEVKEGKHQ